MKKALLIASMLTLILVSAKPFDTRQLTIINKSGMKIALRLQSLEEDLRFYYLPVEKGDRDQPTRKTYEVERDEYLMQLIYIQTYDPVYGFKCQNPPPSKLIVLRDTRIVFIECGQINKLWGEPSMHKYSPPFSRSAIQGTGPATPPIRNLCLSPAPHIRLITCYRFWRSRYIY